MKPKQKFKLSLNKTTVSSLNQSLMDHAKGGTSLDGFCVPTNYSCSCMKSLCIQETCFNWYKCGIPDPDPVTD